MRQVKTILAKVVILLFVAFFGGNVRGAAPSNDDFANRIQLNGSFVSVAGDNTGATIEPTELWVDHSVWWTWTASETVLIEAALYGDVDTILEIGSGDSIDLFQRQKSATIDISKDPYTFVQHQVRFWVNAGFTYQIRVSSGRSNATGKFKFSIGKAPSVDIVRPLQNELFIVPQGGRTNIEIVVNASAQDRQIREVKIGETVLTNAPYSVVVTNVGVGTYAVAVLVTDEIGITNITTVTYRVSEVAVANDNFADRAVLTGDSVRVTAPIEGATMEQGEPLLSQYGGAQRKTIWWRWVAPSSGYYDFATTAAEIEVFKGSQIANLQVATIPNQTGVSAAIPYYQTRYKRAMVQAGEEYAIRVAPRSVYNAPAPDATIGINRYPSLAIDGPPDSGEFSVKPLAAPRQISCVYFLSPYPYDVFHPEIFDGAYSPTPICASPFTTSVGLRPGNYNWYVMAVDELGLQARSELRQFVVKDPTLVNDDFANRIALEGTKFRLAPTTLNSATLEPAEIFQPNTGSLWWSWTCPVSARYGIKVSGPHILKFGVYTGSTLTALAKVVESSGSETNFAAVAGVTYNFQMVASHDTGGGIPPVQADEVRIARVPVVAIVSPQPNSQFPRGGNLRMDVEVTSPDSPVTSVDFFEVRYIGNSPDLVQRGTVTIPPYHLTFTNLPAGSPRTLVAIAHDDFGMSGQSSGLVFSVPTYPVNDHFNQRVRLSGALAEGAASSIGATLEAGEPNSSSAETLWWTWTAPETRTYQLKLLGDFASRLDVFTGDTLAMLVSVGGVTNEYPTRIDRDLSIQANADAVY